MIIISVSANPTSIVLH